MATLDTTSSLRAVDEILELNRKLKDDSVFYNNVRTYTRVMQKTSNKLLDAVESSIYEILKGQLMEMSAKCVTKWLIEDYYFHIINNDALNTPVTVRIQTLGSVQIVLSRPSKVFYLEDPISRLYILNRVGDTLCEVPMYLIHAIYSINALDSAYM